MLSRCQLLTGDADFLLDMDRCHGLCLLGLGRGNRQVEGPQLQAVVGVGIAFWTRRTDCTGWLPGLEDRKHQRDSAAELSLIKDDIDAMRRCQD